MYEIRSVLGTLERSGRHLSALAVPYGIEADVSGQFMETIRRLTPVDDLLLLSEHSPSGLLARSGSGTLHVEERADGIHVGTELPDTGTGRDVAALMDRGDLSGMSFGFVSTTDSWTYAGGPRRSVDDGVLYEVSIVASPVYRTTEATLRSANACTLTDAGMVLRYRLANRARRFTW